MVDMRIVSYFNTLESEVVSRKYNIFIGISLGNKYFTEEHIKKYVEWALGHTKEKVAILIPDAIHAINYQGRNGYSDDRSQRKALREGEKIRSTFESILGGFSPLERSRIEIMRWKDIETEKYQAKVSILFDEFKKNSDFKEEVLTIVKESVSTDRPGGFDYEKLAEYPLRELPSLLSGFEFKGIRYSLLPYPGISRLDHLVVDLQENRRFVDLAKRLNIDSKLRIIEAYAD